MEGGKGGREENKICKTRANRLKKREKAKIHKNLNDKGEKTIKQENFQNYKTTLNNFI